MTGRLATVVMPMTTTAAADGVAAAAPLTIALALGVACALAMMALASWGVMVVIEVLEPMLALTMEVAVLASVVATLATELMSGKLATTDELESELEAVALASELDTVELESLEAVELESEELEPEELELPDGGAPVRASEARSSGIVSMKAIVGPATREFVSWSRMLFSRGWSSDVM